MEIENAAIYNTTNNAPPEMISRNIKGIIVRNDTRRVWAALTEWLGDKNGHRGFWLTGPTGIGKSVEVYAFTMNYANIGHPEQKNILYIREFYKSFIILRYVNGVASICDTKDDKLICQIISSKGITWNLIVLDGVREHMLSFYLEAGYNTTGGNTKYKVICCTFDTSPYGYMSSEAASMNLCTFFKMYSWTLEELIIAFNNGVFGKISYLEFTERYYYAGGAIRWMFHTPTEIKEFLDRKLNTIPNKSIVLNGLVEVSSDEAVNSFVGIYPDNSNRCVSEYVKKLLTYSVDSTFITESYNKYNNNSSWKGWIFEFEFLYNLHRDKVALCRYFSGVSYFNYFYISNINSTEYHLNDHEFNYDEVIAGKDKVAIIPKKWCQECFDFVWYEKINDVHKFKFMNYTIANEHVFNLEHVAVFLGKLFPPIEGVNTRNGTVQEGRNSNTISNAKIEVKICAVIPSQNAKSYVTAEFDSNDVISIQNFYPKFNLVENKRERVYLFNSMMR